MSKNVLSLSIPIVLLSFTQVVNAQSVEYLQSLGLESHTAKSHIRDYLSKRRVADKEHAKEVTDARKELIDSLEDVLKKETQDGELDSALQIRTLIAQLKSIPSGRVEKTTATLEGDWEIAYPDGGARLLSFRVINGKMMLSRRATHDNSVESQGEVTLDKNGSMIYIWPDGQFKDRLHFTGGHLLIEHWGEGKSFESTGYPTHIGFARRIE